MISRRETLYVPTKNQKESVFHTCYPIDDQKMAKLKLNCKTKAAQTILRHNQAAEDKFVTSVEAISSVADEEISVSIELQKQKDLGRLVYMTLVFCVLLTLSNSVMNLIEVQMSRIDSQDLYDSLSSEVLSPPIQYTKNQHSERPSMALGSAAISSVTEVLSPILPFTGGLDLRREENWDTSEGWAGTTYKMIDSVLQAFGLETFAVTRHEESPEINSLTSMNQSKDKERKNNHESILSATSPFVPLRLISNMSLRDLTSIFKYGIDNTRNDFKEELFLDSVSSDVVAVVRKLKQAISKSRGNNVESSITLPLSSKLPNLPGQNIDALSFCGIMRLFAEWRVLRQVPEGYKGYAVGMTLGQKDIIQNVAKIEKAVHEWIEARRESLAHLNEDIKSHTYFSRRKAGQRANTLRSPTLRELLEYEIDINVHDNSRLPRLKDKTAAMGLLWVRRQLQYQTALFENVLHIPRKFPNAFSAVSSAYTDVYGKYHGWAVQKIFGYSFQAAPEVDVIFQFMNPGNLEGKNSDILQAENQAAHRDCITNIDTLNPLQSARKRLAHNLGSILAFIRRKERSQEVVCSSANGNASHEVTRQAHQHISLYLDTVNPLLTDLELLFTDLNMDDPTKV